MATVPTCPRDPALGPLGVDLQRADAERNEEPLHLGAGVERDRALWSVEVMEGRFAAIGGPDLERKVLSHSVGIVADHELIGGGAVLRLSVFVAPLELLLVVMPPPELGTRSRGASYVCRLALVCYFNDQAVPEIYTG